MFTGLSGRARFGIALVLATACSASAGTFKPITIDSDFSDWADVPVLDSDPADNPGSVDIGDIKIANDDDFLYLYNTSHSGLMLSTFLSIDVDSDVSTGFDIFGLGLVGSEACWQNDFPFTQSAGTFNDGLGMSGDFFGIGAALLSPFADATERELAISLDIVFNNGGAPVFADDSFTLMLWTDLGAGDVSAAIPYTLAVPEPASAILLLVSLLGMRRR